MNPLKSIRSRKKILKWINNLREEKGCLASQNMILMKERCIEKV
jgi:hypothetical protein